MTQAINQFEQEIELSPAWLVFAIPGKDKDPEPYKRACLLRYVQRYGIAPQHVEARDNGIWLGPIVEIEEEPEPADDEGQLTLFEEAV
jgi:hypothetical protein